MVVEEGLEYGPAKRRAVRQLGLPPRAPLPGNDEVEEAVREYIAVFCADTQPAELLALRRLALSWMRSGAGEGCAALRVGPKTTPKLLPSSAASCKRRSVRS